MASFNARFSSLLSPGFITSLVVALGAACGSGGGDPPSDAPANADAWTRDCWAGGGTPTPDQVELVLGKGVRTFTPIENGGTIPMRHGLQGGAHLELHARMRGFDPGLKGDPTVPAPHSFFAGFYQDGERITVLDCAFPRPYIDASADAGEGWYELELGSQVTLKADVFPTLHGETVTIRLEVQDHLGHYAMVERTGVVEDVNPPGADGGVTDAGVTDASVTDASVTDAGP